MNGRLIALVAAVAVAAVVTGGVVAARQGPVGDNGDAAVPLSEAGPIASTSAGTPTASPSPTPSATPTDSTAPPGQTARPTTGPPAGAKKVKPVLGKLPTGRPPQVTHLVGREVRGGPGQPLIVPGKAPIFQVARAGHRVLVVQPKGAGSELLRILNADEVDRVADVSSLVTSKNETDAAYATTRQRSDGLMLKGGSVYADTGQTGDSPAELELPDAWDLRVLALVDGTVYFRSKSTADALPWNLYSWTPGDSAATRIKTVTSPTALTHDATKAGAMTVLGDDGTCSALTEVDSGRRLWRSCDYQLRSFTPAGEVAIVIPALTDGYAATATAALDATSGTLLREWSALSFHGAVAEDDDHLLMEVDDGPETKSAIIRCSIRTGACELAVPPALRDLTLGS